MKNLLTQIKNNYNVIIIKIINFYIIIYIIKKYYIYMSEKPKVYFTKVVSPEKLVEIYKKLDIKLEGNSQPKYILVKKGINIF